MDKNTILNNLAKDTRLINYCNILCNGRDIANDLYQECFLKLAETDDEIITKVYNDGKLHTYASNIIYFLNLARKDKRANLNGNYNPFIELCNELQNIDFDLIDEPDNSHEIDIKFDKVIKLLEKEKLSDTLILFESVDKSMKQIHKELDINYMTIFYKRKRIINKIKENIK